MNSDPTEELDSRQDTTGDKVATVMATLVMVLLGTILIALTFRLLMWILL